MANKLHSDLESVIAGAYRRHQHRPSMTASFLASAAADMRHLRADDPERERYCAAAAEWLRRKFDPGAAQRPWRPR
jgi:hypothetical protein